MKTQKIAQTVSAVAHPIIAVPIFAVFNAYKLLHGAVLYTSVGITLLASLFLAAYLLRLNRRGGISDLDASDQKQRQNKVYLPIIAVLSASLGLFYALQQPKTVLLASFCFLFLFIIGYLVNFWIKISLHLAVIVYFAFSFLPNLPFLGIFLLLFCIPLAWSRLFLGRHTPIEVALGTIIGAGLGTFQILYS